jgi:hypothetical protein
MNMESLVSISSVMQGIVALLSLITVIVTIVLVVRQTREMARQSVISAYATAGSTYKDVAVEMMEIDRMFFENPDMRPYFYDGEPPPEDPREVARVLSLAEMFMDFLDMVIVLKVTTPAELNIPWAEYEDYFKDMFLNSPVIRDFYAENREWYDPQVRALFDPLAEELTGKTG